MSLSVAFISCLKSTFEKVFLKRICEESEVSLVCANNIKPFIQRMEVLGFLLEGWVPKSI